jgi:hypothetical protein
LADDVVGDRAGHIEENVISTSGEPDQRIMLRAGHDEPFCALDLFVKAFDAWGNVIGNNVAPELRPKADDEVHSSRRGPWFTNGRDGRCKLFSFLRVQNIKLEVRMRGRSKSKDSSLRRVHAGDYIDTMAEIGYYAGSADSLEAMH